MRKVKRGNLSRGDVESTDSGEPGHKPGRVPEPHERVRIRLHGHPQTYVVRAETGPDGPQLTELTITADDGAVDYAIVQPVVRRLAATAVQWHHRIGGLIWAPGDTTQTFIRPEVGADDQLSAVARLVQEARDLGLPVRKTVREQMHLSFGTLDRLIRRAKDEGLLDDESLPKAPPPRQRDASPSTPEQRKKKRQENATAAIAKARERLRQPKPTIVKEDDQ